MKLIDLYTPLQLESDITSFFNTYFRQRMSDVETSFNTQAAKGKRKSNISQEEIEIAMSALSDEDRENLIKMGITNEAFAKMLRKGKV